MSSPEKKMFSLNKNKTHQMDNRKMEKFKVQHAHTGWKMLHSYMQNLLNEQEAY